MIFVLSSPVNQPGKNCSGDSEGSGQASPWAHERPGFHSDAGHLAGKRSELVKSVKIKALNGGKLIEYICNNPSFMLFFFCLFSELLVPDKANVFYAMSTTANFDFVLRHHHKCQKKALRPTRSLGRFTKWALLVCKRSRADWTQRKKAFPFNF